MPPKRSQPSTIERLVLPNGLRVIVAPDRSSPLVGVAVVYDVGFRSEPEGRTGFAHLFEHLMFQGSENLAKLEHIQLVESAGGNLNGHTMPDLTAYYEAVPSGALDLVLYLEADRMRAVALVEENMRNQVAVVKEEINVNVKNQPYGGFPWIVLPGLAFDSYANSHNGYGDFAHLEEASLAEAKDFYEKYYSPSNAVLCVAGDCNAMEVFELAERHFGAIAAHTVPSHGPWPEPPTPEERRLVIEDPLAPQPAFVAGYRTPDPINDLDDYLAYAVLAEVLGEGDASRLATRLVHEEQLVTDIGCLVGTFGGDTFMMRDPALLQVVTFHPGIASSDELLGMVAEEIGRLAEQGPTDEEMLRVAAMSASSYWRGLDSVLNRALSYASLETIHGRAELVAELPERVRAVPAAAVAAAAADVVSQALVLVEVQPAGAR